MLKEKPLFLRCCGAHRKIARELRYCFINRSDFEDTHEIEDIQPLLLPPKRVGNANSLQLECEQIGGRGHRNNETRCFIASRNVPNSR